MQSEAESQGGRESGGACIERALASSIFGERRHTLGICSSGGGPAGPALLFFFFSFSFFGPPASFSCGRWN